MLIESTLAVKREINFAPASTAEEIYQNVMTIISTPKFSVPLDREFGVDGSIVDKPMNEAAALMSSEIFDAIKVYEPRVNVVSIEFDAGEDGTLRPKVEVEIIET